MPTDKEIADAIRNRLGMRDSLPAHELEYRAQIEFWLDTPTKLPDLELSDRSTLRQLKEVAEGILEEEKIHFATKVFGWDKVATEMKLGEINIEKYRQRVKWLRKFICLSESKL